MARKYPAYLWKEEKKKEEAVHDETLISQSESKALKGDLNSMILLAEIYRDNKQYEMAYFWFLEAIHLREDPRAVFNMGMLYLYGNHVSQDYLKAYRYFENAAKKGDESARFFLDYFEELGIKSETDINEADLIYKMDY